MEGWATVGGYIVMAVPCEGATLTGLVAEVPDSSVNRLDSLERGYSKITVTTTDGEDVKMYVR